MIMKRIGLLLTSLILFCIFAAAQNDKVSVNEKEHNFGVIGDKDGSVSFDFIITNNSDGPLVITNVSTSCGCTTPSWTREPIEKGKTGVVTASYSPLRQSGTFAKSVTVSTNQTSPIGLIIRGEVVKSESIVKKLPPEEEYPVAVGNYLLKTKELSFEKVSYNEKKSITLEVFNNSEKPITQKMFKLPKYITVDFDPAIIPAKTAAKVAVNLEVQDKSLYGDLSGEIILQIDNARQAFPYSVTVEEDFSKWSATQKANAGKINVSSSDLKFENLNSANSKILKISNSGKSELNVRTIKASNPSITVSKSSFVVSPGEIAEIKVNVDKKIQSNLSSNLLIITDDPNMPVYKIAITANK